MRCSISLSFAPMDSPISSYGSGKSGKAMELAYGSDGSLKPFEQNIRIVHSDWYTLLHTPSLENKSSLKQGL